MYFHFSDVRDMVTATTQTWDDEQNVGTMLAQHLTLHRTSIGRASGVCWRQGWSLVHYQCRGQMLT